MTGRDSVGAGEPGEGGWPLAEWVAGLGGWWGFAGVLLCAGLPVVPFALLLAAVLGRIWPPFATLRVEVGVCVALWVLVTGWVFEGVRP